MDMETVKLVFLVLFGLFFIDLFVGVAFLLFKAKFKKLDRKEFMAYQTREIIPFDSTDIDSANLYRHD